MANNENLVDITTKRKPGRVPGTKNKFPIRVRTALQNYIDGGLEKWLEEIDQIEDPGERTNYRLKVLEFVIPKLKAVDITSGQNIKVVVKGKLPDDITDANVIEEDGN